MRKIRSALLRLLVCLGLLAPGQARGADQQLVSMLRLIARSPGASAAQPLPLALYGDQIFYFDVGISDELGTLSFDEYIEKRLELLNASYRVSIIDYGSLAAYQPGMNGQVWVSLDGEQGHFNVPGSLLPGHVYSWYATAIVDAGGGSSFSLRSEELFFHTGSFDQYWSSTGLQQGPGLGYANSLELLAHLQQAELLSLSHQLSGSSDYINFPTATDVYSCTSVNPSGGAALPSPVPGLLELPQLLELGAIMREARELHTWIGQGGEPQGQMNALAQHCRQLLSELEQTAEIPVDSLSGLREVSRRIGQEESMVDQERQAVLSELLLLGDRLAASGSMRFGGDALDACQAYAQSSDRRLRQLSDMDPALYNLLGAERGQFWQEYFRSQRADLVLLRDDIRGGMLDRSRLSQQISAALQRSRVRLPEAFDGNADVRMDEARQAFATLAPAADHSSALRALLEAQLSRIAAQVWPEPD